MISEKKVRVSGEFAIMVKGPDGKDKGFIDNKGALPSDKFQKNLVLDRYFSLANSGKNMTDTTFYLKIGTGTAEPLPTDTSLQSAMQIVNKGTAGVGDLGSSLNAEGTHLEGYYEMTYSYSKGQVVGNISEIGLSETYQSNLLVTRALIKDELGNPTIISVTAEDELTVVYRLNFSFSYDDDVSQIDVVVDGVVVPTEVTTRWADPLYIPYLMDKSAQFLAYNGPLGVKGVGPGGSAYEMGKVTAVGDPDLGITWKVPIGTGFAIPGGVSAVGRITPHNAKAFVKWGFNPPIPKSEIQSIEFNFHIKYERA